MISRGAVLASTALTENETLKRKKVPTTFDACLTWSETALDLGVLSFGFDV